MNVLTTLWRNNKGMLFFLGLMLVFRSAIADWNYIPSSSMNPTLVQGDRVVVNKLAYSLRVPFTLIEIARWAQPQRGDVITFDSPLDNVNLIKRAMAVAGDVVEMRHNTLFINGHEVARTLVAESQLLPTESGPLNAEIWRETLDAPLGHLQFDVARLPQANRFQDFGPVTVPADKVLALGDSRDNSNDSRFIGFIDTARITGQAVRVALSHNPDAAYLPRADRWWLALHL